MPCTYGGTDRHVPDSSMSGWIGVDLDGTLAHYEGWRGPEHIGEPIPAMVTRVKEWLAEGREVRIFTGRIAPAVLQGFETHGGTRPSDQDLLDARQSVAAIGEWSEKHLGRRLPVTCVKDFDMIELWDDRAVQVEKNTGRRMDHPPEGPPTP